MMDRMGRLDRMLGLCAACHSDPCKCPKPASAASTSTVMSSATMATLVSAPASPYLARSIAGGIHPEYIKGEVTVKAVEHESLWKTLEVKPSKTFKPSWEIEEGPEDPIENLRKVKAAAEAIKKAITADITEAMQSGDLEKAKSLLNMTATELLEHYR